ncbi:MAG: cell division protein FtsA [bacterium]
MAKKEEFYVGLDIGSSKICAVVGVPNKEDEGLRIVGVGTSRLTGLRKGVVSEIEETVSGISEAIEIAERSCGFGIDHTSINLNGGHISSINSRGTVAVGKADQEITKNDLARAEDAAQAIQIQPNKQILHVIPRFFMIDNSNEPVKDPIGMSGVRLEVETHIVTASQQILKNLSKCVTQTGLKTDDTIATPLASAKAVLDKRQRELGCALIDIGAETTGLVIFEEDSILYTKVFPIGANSVTNDIAIGLRTSIDVAEKVKIKFGHSFHKEVSEKEKIDLSSIDMKEEGVFSRKHVAEICEARMEEIFKIIRDELRRINKDTLLPAGIVITGGGAKLLAIDLLAKDCFKLPVEITKPHSLTGLTDKIYDPEFSTAVGLMLYAYEENIGTSGSLPSINITGRVRKILKLFLP